MRSALTYLYVPGDVPERFDKALASGTDAVVLDLEDAVTAANKDHARATVAAWVAACEPGVVQIWVRVNPGALQESDIRAVLHPNLTGLWLPKVSSAREVEQAVALLGESSVVVSPLIETAGGVFAALEIARAPRVRFLQIGEVDLAADLGVDGSAESLSFVRAQVVAASVAAGIDPPPAAVSRNFRDSEAFEADTRTLAGLGFVGRACIHPAQLAPVRTVFVPTEDEVREAEQLLADLERAESGVAVDSKGFLIDEAVARTARRVVERGAARETISN
ncbi:HpcH/HpaI aldolase/citrate lyase family protein [Rhodococcus sp. IEGM 1330]|uniref:HpcH/HpaI aldolase/citrate lyase family protein n=1 Tax=Rhodococcus sp. IEGM 1330 TaxID=3082225 RepID=UPI002954D807|nr:aldolase/citrate lyase family protein [Rhodococcus sp. IEGM 1330]MDV8023789.1 aldolase/citrate lyase family protein [Rhodococcus sp. IEGM 1330]